MVWLIEVPAPDMESAGEATAALSSLYCLFRNTRSQRRTFLQQLLKLFDEAAKTPLEEMIYVADNLSALPYQTLEEPLFIIYEAEKVISVSGGNVQQTFKVINCQCYSRRSTTHPVTFQDRESGLHKLQSF